MPHVCIGKCVSLLCIVPFILKCTRTSCTFNTITNTQKVPVKHTEKKTPDRIKVNASFIVIPACVVHKRKNSPYPHEKNT